MRWGAGRVSTAVVVVCAVGLMTGCAMFDPPIHSTPTPTQKVKESDTEPVAAQLPNLLVAGQTIGTGELRVVDHEPISDPVAEHPVTGSLRLVVRPDLDIDVRIRPDDPASVDLTGIDLLLTGQRYDGKPENIQDQDFFGLIAEPKPTDADGELVLRLELDSSSIEDPTFLHSLVERPAGDARVMAAATITWNLPSSFPGLRAVDGGAAEYARGRTVVDGGTPAYYVPSPDDTVFQVSRRFGLTEAQLVWLNPELLMDSFEPQLTTGVGVNLDPARR